MAWVDAAYRDLIRTTMMAGSTVKTRNEEVRRTILRQVVFSQTPLVSLRRTAWKTALREMEWFLSGSNDIKDAHPSVRPWWEPWANQDGRVINNYADQFRGSHGAVLFCESFDQIEHAVATLRDRPYSRRNVMTTWNPAEMADPDTPITNCHGTLIQLFVEPGGDLVTMKAYQRSCDLVCGVPHNWIQYWALLRWLAHRAGRKVGELVWEGGDVHIYPQHFGLVEKMLAVDAWDLPQHRLAYEPKGGDATVFRADDFALEGNYFPAVEERAVMVV